MPFWVAEYDHGIRRHLETGNAGGKIMSAVRNSGNEGVDAAGTNRKAPSPW
jgi:hypothetical protein